MATKNFLQNKRDRNFLELTIEKEEKKKKNFKTKKLKKILRLLKKWKILVKIKIIFLQHKTKQQ